MGPRGVVNSAPDQCVSHSPNAAASTAAAEAELAAANVAVLRLQRQLEEALAKRAEAYTFHSLVGKLHWI